MLLLSAGAGCLHAPCGGSITCSPRDDPTAKTGAAWGVKERLRQLLARTDLEAADHTRGLLGITVLAADMDETWRLWETVNAWWDEIETFTETRVTNARSDGFVASEGDRGPRQ
jgi:Transposase